MPIIYDNSRKIFHLQTGNTSYIMQIVKEKYLVHLYWGRRISSYHESRQIIWKDRGFAPNPDAYDRTFSLDTLPQEYPQIGNGDFRSPAYGIRQENGSRISNLEYTGYEIMDGKPILDGLPASFGTTKDVQTLKIYLEDPVAGLKVCLMYSIFEDQSIITRSVQFLNASERAIYLTKMLSMSIDFREDEFDVLTLYGAHNNERNMDRRPLTSGIVQIESLRGTSSPHQAPFMALLRKGTDEDQGEVFAANFVYSGNFIATAQVDPYRNVRFQMGMNPWNSEWKLEAEQKFQTPEVIMAYSSQGLGEMSHTYHRFYQNHLIRSPYATKERPILINNWEATFFDFNEEKILSLAKKAADVGIELFVLDDGWFGHRDSDNSSLGDWYVDKRKLPNGLKSLAEKIHKMGMKFGLWFEPEMISEDSDLFRKHPDYALHTEGRPYTIGRGQLVLDLSRKEVCDYVITSIRKILKETPIDYVKWDMNRHLTDIGSLYFEADRQGEIAHRYVLGLYYIMETLTSEFSEILFESCSSGGGRFDPGMLYYMPQTWCSDNTDAVCRMKIQYATSLTYSPVMMGAHVSVSPNQQTGRITPLSTRGYVAMSGNFGYELDLENVTEDEMKMIKDQIICYKEIRPIIQQGDFYRIQSPFDGNIAAWNFVSSDKKKVVAYFFEILSQPAAPVRILKLKGLKPDGFYRRHDTGDIYSGDELMYCGISIPLKKQDFRGEMYRFEQIEKGE